jgi:hypothetical protein
MRRGRVWELQLWAGLFGEVVGLLAVPKRSTNAICEGIQLQDHVFTSELPPNLDALLAQRSDYSAVLIDGWSFVGCTGFECRSSRRGETAGLCS